MYIAATTYTADPTIPDEAVAPFFSAPIVVLFAPRAPPVVLLPFAPPFALLAPFGPQPSNDVAALFLRLNKDLPTVDNRDNPDDGMPLFQFLLILTNLNSTEQNSHITFAPHTDTDLELPPALIPPLILGKYLDNIFHLVQFEIGQIHRL